MQQLHYTHHQPSLVMSCYTTLVPSLGLCIGPACGAGLSTGMQRNDYGMKVNIKKTKSYESMFKNLAIANRSLLVAFHSNYGDILYRLRDTTTDW